MPFLALGVCSSNFTAMNGQTQWGIPHSLVHELTHDGPGKDIQMSTCPLLPPGNSYPSTVEWGLFSEELVRVPGDGSLLAKFGRKFHRIYAFRGILFPDCADALFEVVKFMALRKVNTSFRYSFFFFFRGHWSSFGISDILVYLQISPEQIGNGHLVTKTLELPSCAPFLLPLNSIHCHGTAAQLRVLL